MIIMLLDSSLRVNENVAFYHEEKFSHVMTRKIHYLIVSIYKTIEVKQGVSGISPGNRYW